MLFAWKIEYLSKSKDGVEIHSVVVITDKYEFGIAERYFRAMYPAAKRVIAIEYICEAARDNLKFDPGLEMKFIDRPGVQ